MNSLMMERWSAEQRELPGMNCIAFANGDIIILDIRKVYDPNNNESTMYCTPLCNTTIDSVEKYNHDCWTMVDVWASVEFRDGKIVGGDGAMGNEGFIACVDADDHLVWAIFLENTNPIKKLSVNDHRLVAINEHEDLKIEIDLHNIVDIKMTFLE